jgi:radical SAM superfamily enzyme YgiQ (UPF0313 family)
MDIALIDYEHPKEGFANRDQTGGFGSGMTSSGLVGSIITRLKKSKIRVPNLTLAYLNAIARKHGRVANFYSGMPSGEALIVIASSMVHHKYELEFAHEIADKYPNSKITFIGPFSSEMPQLYRDYADFLIIGEPEEVFEQLCIDGVIPDSDLNAVNKVDLSGLPFPLWNGFDIENFGYAPGLPRKPFLTIQASRGCPFACEFCPYLVSQGIPLRQRNVESVINEMRYLVDEYGIKSLLFRDITWSMNKKYSKELCHAMIKENFDLDIGIETRADTLDQELIKLMSEAGIKVVNLGIESPSEDILKGSGRVPIKESKLESSLRLLDENGIDIQAFYMLGLIDDTVESMKNTIAYSRHLNTYTAQFCVLTPFPGTKTYSDLEPILLTRDFSKFTEYEPVVKVDGVTPEQIKHYMNVAFNGYYLRFSWIFKHGFKAVKSIIMR